jgi:lysozyme
MNVLLSKDPPQCGIDLIKQFEGLKQTAYKCSADVWTIGYGHTGNVYPGMTCSASSAEEYLKNDLAQAWKTLKSCVKVPLTYNQAGALLSWCYNVGGGAVEKSTLIKLLNQRYYDQVPIQLMRWNKVNGEVLGGLSRRRASEARLWNTPDNPITQEGGDLHGEV